LIITWNNGEISDSEQQKIFALPLGPETTPLDVFEYWNVQMMEEAVQNVMKNSDYSLNPLGKSEVISMLYHVCISIHFLFANAKLT
jgi:hypothetical protein